MRMWKRGSIHFSMQNWAYFLQILIWFILSDLFKKRQWYKKCLKAESEGQFLCWVCDGLSSSVSMSRHKGTLSQDREQWHYNSVVYWFVMVAINLSAYRPSFGRVRAWLTAFLPVKVLNAHQHKTEGHMLSRAPVIWTAKMKAFGIWRSH